MPIFLGGGWMDFTHEFHYVFNFSNNFVIKIMMFVMKFIINVIIMKNVNSNSMSGFVPFQMKEKPPKKHPRVTHLHILSKFMYPGYNFHANHQSRKKIIPRIPPDSNEIHQFFIFTHMLKWSFHSLKLHLRDFLSLLFSCLICLICLYF